MSAPSALERGEPDNTQLLQLSEETLLQNTVQRFGNGDIYTFTGHVVTSLNYILFEYLPCAQKPSLGYGSLG